MIGVTTTFHVHTGNIFGVAIGWPEAFAKAAHAIDDNLQECDWDTNPAFAGTWCVCFSREKAEAIARRWRQLLPLALRSMSDYWREDYDRSVGLRADSRNMSKRSSISN